MSKYAPSDASTASLPSSPHNQKNDDELQEIKIERKSHARNQTKQESRVEMIDLDSSEDENLKQAIALSLLTKQPSPAKPEPQQTSQVASSVLGMDRVQMERDRLARLGQTMPNPLKRKAESPPLPSQTTLKKQAIQFIESTLLGQGWKPPFLTHVIAAPYAKSRSGSEDLLPNLTLSDILHPNGRESRDNSTGHYLVRALVTSYDWDEQFNYILSRLPLIGQPSEVFHSEKAKQMFRGVMLVVHEKDEAGWRKCIKVGGNAHQSITVACAPLRGPGSNYPGVFHPKMGMLSFVNDDNGFLRIWISTANVNARDWEMVDNLLYVQDFPLLKPSSIQSDLGREFCTYLKAFLQAMGCLPDDIMASLDKYDYSNVKVRLVGSIPGKFFGSQWGLWGLSRLCKVISAFGMAALPFPPLGREQERKLKLECQTSSLGKLDYQWLHNFYACCAGNAVNPVFGKSPVTQDLPIQIIYPSQTNVEKVGVRRPGIEALFLQRKYWQDEKYAKKYFRESESKKIVHSHTKSILGSGVKDKECWMYLGSHNLSKAAWGMQMKKDMDGYPTIVNNWELGVVFMCDQDQADWILRYQRPAAQYDARGPFCRDDVE